MRERAGGGRRRILTRARRWGIIVAGLIGFVLVTLTVPLPAQSDTHTSAEAAPVELTNAAAPPPAPPITPPGPPVPVEATAMSEGRVPLATSNVVGGVPWIQQVYPLSCEEAALQMALAHQGIRVTQAQILDVIGVDERHGRYEGSTLRWGNPYTSFVGDPSGREEDLSGYGTYHTAIARAATRLGGQVLRSGEGIPAEDVYRAVLENHPVVVWVTSDWAFHARHDYLTFDGQWVLFAGPVEHAMTVIGVRPDAVLVNDPDRSQYWISRSVFEASYATYNRMAVILT